MAVLLKTSEVDQDLIDIWHYTSDQSGVAQADKYLRKIDASFEKIKQGRARLKTLADKVRFIRYEHHYIFIYTDKTPVVIVVLHEKRDVVARLGKSLR
jgi:plasmid stabilization system protein ParE